MNVGWNRNAVSVSFALLASLPISFASRAEDHGASLTIYSSADPAGFDPQQFIAQNRNGYDFSWIWGVPGFGVVKELRSIDLESGVNNFAFTDVAQFIDPTTVSFTDLTDPDSTSVLEQNFQFDLVSPQKIMERYIDQEIGFEVKEGDTTKQMKGRLLSVNQGQAVVQTSDGLRFLNVYDPGIRLPALPSGLITKPTLLWKVDSQVAGKHLVRTTYQTAGLTWRSDYNLILNAEESAADLGAWVTLLNVSGASWKDAQLKLIAGDVQRIQPQNYYGAPTRSMVYDLAMEKSAGFVEKAFFEYHLYTLPRPTDILANTTQQITLFPTAHDVPVEKVLVYYGLPDAAQWSYQPTAYMDRDFGNQSNKKVDVYIRFRNDEASNLGIPLPKGKVRVYKVDDDGTAGAGSGSGNVEFIGEDLIDHTPKDEKVLVKVGQSFDVVGERTQTDFAVDVNGHWIRESFEIRIRNHKAAAQKVLIKENLYRWSNWEIIEPSLPFSKIDSRTVHFETLVPADGETVLTYTVKYTW